MENRKILFIVSSAPMYPGDMTAPFILNMAKDLSDLGWEVDILAPHAPNLALNECIEGVQFRRFRYFFERWQTLCYRGGVQANLIRSKINLFLVPCFIIAELIAAFRLIRKKKYALIHSHWIIPQGLVGTICAKLLKIPHVTSIHGADIHTFNSKLVKSLKKYALDNAEVIIANSSSSRKTAEELSARITDKICVIPTGATPVDTDSNNNMWYEKKLHTSIIFVGRIVLEKGLPYLLKALAAVQLKHQVKLTVVGDGPELANCIQEANDLGINRSVTFVGAAPHNEVYRHLQRADIFVGPSITLSNGWTEAQGNTFVEAMLCGLPVIASNIGGIPDAVINGETGLLVEEKSHTEIAEAITKLIENPELRIRLSNNGQKHALENFSRYATAEKISRIYQCALKRGK
ncbi:glycosyltransferase family 4 protein [Teredinibacter turnerae]|uniref:glycosyltransferase family 4 protein n=1 Tax=Teredinibacter turnerae TaxID=2426 RepID=UPI0005F7FC1E|nr:glycosyltransferase family 4 protein [Teredinibacter turnerae]